MPKLQIKLLFKTAFETYKLNWKFLTLVTLIASLARFIPNFLQNLFDTPWLYYSLTFIGWIIGIVVTLGLIKTILDLVDNNQKDFKNLYQHSLPIFIPFLLTSIIYSLIILGGVILLIIPGIILALMFQFATYAVVDQNLKPKQALKLSKTITKGHLPQLFLITLALGLINLLAALLFLLPLIFTIPTSLLVMAYTYRQLNPNQT